MLFVVANILLNHVNSVGDNLKAIVERPDDEYCFRLLKDRVYYVRSDVLMRATNVGRKQLISLGTCLGKFTGSGKFMLQITALELLAQFASVSFLGIGWYCVLY